MQKRDPYETHTFTKKEFDKEMQAQRIATVFYSRENE